MNRFATGGLLALLATSAIAQPAPGRGGPPPADHYALIHAGTLLAVPGSPPQARMTVVVKNDKVAAVLPGFLDAAPDAAPGSVTEVIDLSDRFVMPGLMDAHVHLQSQPMFSRRRTERGDRNPPSAAENTVNAVEIGRAHV